MKTYEAFLEDYADDLQRWPLELILELYWHFMQDGCTAVEKRLSETFGSSIARYEYSLFNRKPPPYDWKLSTRANCFLRNHNIHNAQDLPKLTSMTLKEALETNNFGRNSANEIRTLLEENGLYFKDDKHKFTRDLSRAMKRASKSRGCG